MNPRTTAPKPHDIITCPYNMSHQVEHYRMHIHLQKCRKQHPNSGKVNCPFDATHVVNELELNYHVTLCPKRVMLDTQMFVVDDDQRPVVPVVHSNTSDAVLDDWGNIHVIDDYQRPVVSVIHSNTSDAVLDEWGNEPHHSTYTPDFSKKGPHVIQKIKGATPSERRKARMEFIKNYKPPE